MPFPRSVVIPAADQNTNRLSMTRHRILLAALFLLLPSAGWPQDAVRHVYSDAGNIYVERGGAKIKLTTSEMDVDPMLAPGGGFVIYTRQGRGRGIRGYDASQVCTTEP